VLLDRQLPFGLGVEAPPAPPEPAAGAADGYRSCPVTMVGRTRAGPNRDAVFFWSGRWRPRSTGSQGNVRRPTSTPVPASCRPIIPAGTGWSRSLVPSPSVRWPRAGRVPASTSAGFAPEFTSPRPSRPSCAPATEPICPPRSRRGSSAPGIAGAGFSASGRFFEDGWRGQDRPPSAPGPRTIPQRGDQHPELVGATGDLVPPPISASKTLLLHAPPLPAAHRAGYRPR